MRLRRIPAVGCSLLLGLAIAAPTAADDREPCADRDPLRKPLFGDTHVHTGYSIDARAQDNRSTPRDA